jgi:hypothetical protein
VRLAILGRTPRIETDGQQATSMVFDIILVIVTAVITAALTLAAAWYLYHRFVKQLLMDWIDTRSEELGAELEDRVRDGVERGIRDGVSSLGADVVKKTGEGAVRTGLGIIEDGMSVWLRPGKKRPGGDGET